MSPGLNLDAIRLSRASTSSAGTDGSAKAARKFKSGAIDGEQHLFDGGCDDGFNVPHGAIRVRSGYVGWIRGFERRTDSTDRYFFCRK